MGRHRLAVQRPCGAVEYGAAALVVAAVVTVAVRLLVWVDGVIVRWWPAVVAIAVLGAVAGIWRAVSAARRRAEREERLLALRFTLTELDAMDDREFEFALRDLLIRDGWSARQVGHNGDQAADVIADHPQYGRLVVQAKHTKLEIKPLVIVWGSSRSLTWEFSGHDDDLPFTLCDVESHNGPGGRRC